jgi:DNA-binding response OmpR family regulator
MKMAEHEAGILVVDDEAFFREAIGDILTKEGMPWTAVETGEAAIERAVETRIGVVVLDVRLPDTDGIHVLRRLRELRPALRVIMLSSSTDQEIVLEALRLGACDYLAKPLHDEELVLAVRRARDSYSVESEWNRLRGRLDRLVARVEELSRRAAGCGGEERNALLLEGTAQAASEVLEAGKTSLMLLNETGEELRVVAAVGRGMKPGEMDPVAAGEGVAGVVMERREPMVVEEAESDALVSSFGRTGRYETGSFALAPLLVGGDLLGVLCVTDRAAGGRFTGDDLGLLRLLAMQSAELLSEARIAPAVDPATTADDLQALSIPAAQVAEVLPKTEDGEDAERDAELARQICQALVDEVEPARVLDAALRPLVSLLPAAPVSLYMLDASSGDLVCEAECDGGVCGDRPTIERGRGLTGSVLQSGGMIASQDPESDPRFALEIDTPQGGQPRPMLCVPLTLRGKVIGVCRAFLQDGGVACARTGEVLAAALSAAVRNALLYRSLVETIEEVAEARREARR